MYRFYLSVVGATQMVRAKPVTVTVAATYAFNDPFAITSDGTYVWIVNGTSNRGDSLTEVNASNGSLVQTLSGRDHFGFNGISGVTTRRRPPLGSEQHRELGD